MELLHELGEIGGHLVEFFGDDGGDDLGTVVVEVGAIGGFVVFGFADNWGIECVGFGNSELVVQVYAAREEVNEGDLLFGGDFGGGVGPGFEFAADFVLVENAAGEGGDEDGFGADGAGFFDEAGEVLREGGGGVGFAFGAFAGHVVVAELDEDVGGFGVEDLLPVFAVTETFGALAAAGEVEAFGVGAEEFGEGGTPSGGVGDGGVTGEGDAGAGFFSGADAEAEGEQEEEAAAEHGRSLTSDFLPSRTVNGAAHVQPVGFEVGGGVEEGVGGPVEWFELVLAGGEAGEGVFEVGLVVGLEEELAAIVDEDAVEAVEEFALIDEAAGGVAFLGPGIGAEEVEAGDAGGGEEPADGVGAFEAHDAGVGKLLGVDLAGGFDDAAEHALDAEEVALGVVGGHAGEEGAVAAAEIDFEGAGGVGEDFSAGEFAEVIGGREEGGH